MWLCQSQVGGEGVVCLLVSLSQLPSSLVEARGGQKVLVERVSRARKTKLLTARAPSSLRRLPDDFLMCDGSGQSGRLTRRVHGEHAPPPERT